MSSNVKVNGTKRLPKQRRKKTSANSIASFFSACGGCPCLSARGWGAPCGVAALFLCLFFVFWGCFLCWFVLRCVRRRLCSFLSLVLAWRGGLILCRLWRVLRLVRPSSLLCLALACVAFSLSGLALVLPRRVFSGVCVLCVVFGCLVLSRLRLSRVWLFVPGSVCGLWCLLLVALCGRSVLAVEAWFGLGFGGASLLGRAPFFLRMCYRNKNKRYRAY